jgi:hypothetical protein
MLLHREIFFVVVVVARQKVCRDFLMAPTHAAWMRVQAFSDLQKARSVAITHGHALARVTFFEPVYWLARSSWSCSSFPCWASFLFFLTPAIFLVSGAISETQPA